MTPSTQSKLSLIRDQRGLTTVEYIIVLGLVAVFCIGAWGLFGERLDREVGESDKTMTEIVPRGNK